MSEHRKGMSADTWTAIAATATAIIALGVAVWQGCVTREHNRLSVRPALAFRIQKARGDDPVGLYLKNHGAGPAFIQAFKIQVDGETVSTTLRGGWAEASIRMALANIPLRTGSLTPKTVFAPGDERFLFGIEPEDQTADNVERFRKAVSSHSLSVEVTYASLYDENFTASHDNWQTNVVMRVPMKALEEIREQTESTVPSKAAPSASSDVR